ncbi:MAG: hypothetical protein M3R13_12030 [Armatimonadota bacterium]|nr:hypothetical protein [Armatimonadota bacterium]
MYAPLIIQDEGTIPVLVGTSSAAIALPANIGPQLELENSGAARVFVRFGGSTVAATAGTAHATAPTLGSYSIGPGLRKIITRPQNATHMAHISGTAAQTLYVTPGTGQ